MESELIKNIMDGNAKVPFQQLQGKKGALVSTVTLNRFIKEEAIHDDYSLSADDYKSIRNYSSGEQKKLLIEHLFSKNPDFIVLDSVFDMLDTASRAHLHKRLHVIAEDISIIQVFKRREEILPFINFVVRLESEELLSFESISSYDDAFPTKILDGDIAGIPKPITPFDSCPDPLVQFKSVSVSYGERKILNDINWEINKGDFWHLIGPNGSGKTTLLTMLIGDNPKAYGQNLILFGRKKGSGESVWDIKKKIGYVTPAMTVLFKGRHSVENMVISGLHDSIGLYKIPTFEEKKLAHKWIRLIGLESEKTTYFSKLTEEKQCMVLIARSMIKHPPLLILDEPTHGLDDSLVSLLTILINKIAEESTTSIIYVSHKAEKGLAPKQFYELIPGNEGSIGKIKSNHS